VKTAQIIFRIFAEAGEEIFLVGGRVRDQLLGMETGDLDFATSAMPEVTADILRDNGIRPIPTGMEFGTVSGILHEGGLPVEVQVTTFRHRENYAKGSRHPSVQFGGTLEEDLARRDFTVNAIAMDSGGRIIDPLGGLADIRGRLIRTPLDPMVTLGEDPLRMLRAYRFCCRLGFTLDPILEEAVHSLHAEILCISRERWKMEMDSILSSDDARSTAGTLQALRLSGLLEDMIPELTGMFHLDGLPQGSAHRDDIWNHTLDVVSHTGKADLETRWAALLHDLGKPAKRTMDDEGNPHFFGHEAEGASLAGKVCERFRFSRRDRNTVVFLVENHMRPAMYLPEWGDGAVRRLQSEAGENLDRLLDLAAADIAAHAESFAADGALRLAQLRRRLACLPYSGGERLLPRELGKRLLAEAGDGGGAAVGIILRNLEEAVHRGELPSMAASQYYQEYLKVHPELREPGS
jgi:poly(A) polymerase